jgi:hypothetical protein
MRYDIEETAVYGKYVRWCGRTGPRGPSYPMQVRRPSLTGRAVLAPNTFMSVYVSEKDPSKARVLTGHLG